jgi:hypothetical protein
MPNSVVTDTSPLESSTVYVSVAAWEAVDSTDASVRQARNKTDAAGSEDDLRAMDSSLRISGKESAKLAAHRRSFQRSRNNVSKITNEWWTQDPEN